MRAAGKSFENSDALPSCPPTAWNFSPLSAISAPTPTPSSSSSGSGQAKAIMSLRAPVVRPDIGVAIGAAAKTISDTVLAEVVHDVLGDLGGKTSTLNGSDYVPVVSGVSDIDGKGSLGSDVLGVSGMKHGQREHGGDLSSDQRVALARTSWFARLRQHSCDSMFISKHSPHDTPHPTTHTTPHPPTTPPTTPSNTTTTVTHDDYDRS